MANPYTDYAKPVRATAQSQPIAGREAEMAPNNAGGFGFVMDDWLLLERFLILGSTGGTYYVSQKKLTADNAGVVIRCLKADGSRAVELAREINVSNRAPKTDQQLFVLALALQHGDAETKRAVFAAVPQMVRTGTHLLHLVAMFDSLGGWNRTKRLIVKRWLSDDENQVAFQVLKYRQRDGWSQRDALRMSHPKPASDEHQQIFSWVTGRLDLHSPLPETLPPILAKYQAMMASHEPDVALERALFGVSVGLPREALPTEVLQHPEVQRALLPGLPMHALLRNLGNLSAPGVLRDEDAALVAKKLCDSAALRRSRVHPFAVLLATLVYRGGHGFRGSKTWEVNKTILSALEDAYELAFDAVAPTGKRILVGVDVSLSMAQQCIGTPIKASTAAAAVALTLARLEPNARVVTFDTAVRKTLTITKRTGIASLEEHSGGGTDVSAPVTWATQRADAVDMFVILTDNETWFGPSHPTQALAEYRRRVNPGARLICCSMASNLASVVDPSDPLQLGVAGLDANVPNLVADFINR